MNQLANTKFKSVSKLIHFRLPFFLTVLLIGSWSIIPLLQTGFFFIHDFQHVARLFEMNKALLAGQFPVRWVEGLGFGYGYPLFNFYPPLSYYLGEIFHLLGAGYIDSIKLVWGTALLGSGLAMYFLGKEFWGKWGGVVSATLYLYAPYHAIDAYVRGALAELFSFVWLPLILLFSYRSIRNKKLKDTLWTGIFLAALMVTHNLIFLPFFGFYLLWLGSLFFILRPNLKKYFLASLIQIVIGFGLSAFFSFPALAEKQFTLVDGLLLKNLASYKIHFVCPNQLWDSMWGFGGSAAGCVDGISFKIGKVHILLALLSFLLAGWQIFRRKKLENLPGILLVSGVLAFLATYLTTDFSRWIWDLVTPLGYLQFPWRLLEFVILFLSILGGGVVWYLKKWPKIQITAAFGVVAIVLAFNIKYFVPQFTTNQTDRDATSSEEIKWNVSQSSFEYLPKGMATYQNEIGDMKVKIDKNTISDGKLKWQNGPQTNFEIVSQSPTNWEVKVDLTSAQILQFPVVDFPGWRVWINDQEVKINANNDLKLITVNVPAGKNLIELKFTNTNVRTLGNMITLLTLFGVGGGFLYATRRSQT